MHLLIAGIPGTGKSTFARWLVAKHGYSRCPSGEEPGHAFFEEIDAARTASEKVVIDWGFPTGMLDQVRLLIESGFEHWWFDGARDAALETFLARTGHPGELGDWNTQLANVEAHWPEIATLFEGRILHVISSGPTHVSNEERWARIQTDR